MRKLKLLLAGLLVGLMPLCGFAQQQTVDLPTTHQIVRTTLNSNATDAESRLTVLETIPPFHIGTLADISQFLNAGVYELPGDHYNFAQDINFGTARILLTTAGTTYNFSGSRLPLITYTGTLPFITTSQTGILLELQNFFVTTPNATFINMTNNNSLIVTFVVFLNCKLAGNIDAFNFISFSAVPIIGCDDGFIVNDVASINLRFPQYNDGADVGGNYMTLTGAASERLIVSSIDARPSATESFFSIQASYAGDVSIVGGVLESGGGPFFNASGRDQTDLSIIVEAVKNVQNSQYAAAVHVGPGDEAATVVVLDTQVIVAGTFTEDVAERFTTNAAGRITYTGKETRVFNFNVKLLATPASGTNKNYDFYLRLNGTTLVAVSFDTVNVDSGTPGKAILIGEVELSTTDFLELIVIGRSPTPTNLTCEALAFVIF